jgi:nicotinamidase-related amidase
MSKNRIISRRAILQSSIALAGTLAAAQLSSAQKAQAQVISSSQRKGILLAVDLQNGFLTTPECKAVVSKVVDQASQFHQVWATRFFNRNANFSRQLDWNEMVSGSDTELSAALISSVSKTFDKSSYSPMSTDLLDTLKRDAITTVVLCGVDTDACVMATALGLFDAEFETFVASDGCASSGGKEYHEAAINILKRNIGEKYVIPFAELPHLGGN